MSRIAGAWLEHPGTAAVMHLLERGGHRALFVGGCVRDALLDVPVRDVDVATDATPERVLDLAEADGIRAVPTGIDHGTVTLIAEGRPFEVTTFRRDVQTDGRHAVVAYADRIEDDAARRDFTINALYATSSGEVVDPLGGGLADLQARHVRFVGDARGRIVEDYLRILRFFRFQAWYGDPAEGLDAEGLAACAELAEGIDALSAERIGAETLKLLAAPDPAPTVASMGMAGILGRVLPGAEQAALPVLIHLEQALGAAPEPLRRLAILGGEVGRLRLSREQARRLETLRGGIGSEAGTAELAWRLGAETARDIELLRGASFGAPLPAALQADLERGAAAQFPLSGADLKGRFEGPELGAKLRQLEARWIASDFGLDRDTLLREA